MINPQPTLPGEERDHIRQIALGYIGDNNGFGRSNAEAIFREGLLNNDHGVVSAIIFWNFAFLDAMQILEIDRQKKDRTRETIKKSITAMALHNLHRTFPGLRIRRNGLPLAFLLAFCDELQEWGRPTIKELFRSDNPIEDSPDADGWRFLNELKIEKEGECLKITFCTNKEDESRTNRLFKNLEDLFKKVFLPNPDRKEEFKLSVGSQPFTAKTERGKYVVTWGHDED